MRCTCGERATWQQELCDHLLRLYYEASPNATIVVKKRKGLTPELAIQRTEVRVPAQKLGAG